MAAENGGSVYGALDVQQRGEAPISGKFPRVQASDPTLKLCLAQR